jgi:hypothetical protein
MGVHGGKSSSVNAAGNLSSCWHLTTVGYTYPPPRVGLVQLASSLGPSLQKLLHHSSLFNQHAYTQPRGRNQVPERRVRQDLVVPSGSFH